ncbi:MAG: aromatic ring-hydroxylating dioxygenase subunit alpha [Hydrocarboniphaga sp.]|uniref:aromatic ring-hydroxylating oxygenase subunit alpha n=1 Tax=Hydrocarboniphaga sp. TaxID=2033016 RepID=UPI00262EDB6B|nr:aromatic ring-hydroxylating dioxygenase subunit alpha [Hydrocarboniphaga sp.]MDB5968610.1 aromatic ring-hydroxylating dioxygenase subunit alpha [Hydrocarboniphaga sp.]
MNELAQRTALKNASGGGSSWPPSWNTMPHGISVGRYIDPAFAALEYEKLWSKVWQAAARLDEIPQAGDYTVYNIGDQSVLLVRTNADTVKVYHNVCPHRGTALGEGSGTFENSRIMCPFHGWRWSLEGQTQFILERQEFRGGELRDSDVALKEVHSVVFAGFVFINLDRNPQPFDEFIAPIRTMMENLAVGEMRHYWWKAIPVPANWKVAQEAFFEAFHVPATHPQLEVRGAKVVSGLAPETDFVDFTHRNVVYEVFDKGHGRFIGGKKTPMQGHVSDMRADTLLESMAARLSLLVVGMDAQVLQKDVDVLLSLRGKPIPEDSSLGGEYIKALYKQAGEQQRPMPAPTPENLGMWGGEVFLFPNVMILPQAGNAMIYRVRPDGLDPDKCVFEIMSTTTYPAGHKVERAVVEQVTDLQDPEQVLLIPRQDLSNIPRMQKGLHSRGIRQTWLAVEQEKIILNMHRELDRYLHAEA